MQVAHGLYGHQPMKMPHLYLWNKNRRITYGISHVCPRSISGRSSFMDTILWMAPASTCCGCVMVTQYSVGRRECFLCEGVPYSHLWAQDTSQPRTLVSIQLQRQRLGWHRRDIVLGPICNQTDWRLEDVVIFCRLFTDATFWSCVCSCEAEVVVSAWQSCSPNGEDIWQLLNATYPQRWTGGGGMFNRFLSPDIYPMDFSCRDTWRRTFTHFFLWLLEICWQEFRQMWKILMPRY